MIAPGLKNEKRLVVSRAHTALSMGSGTLPVFATPAMIALMENTCAESLAPLLDPGVTSVGTQITVSHLRADPVGEEVICESELISVDGRKYAFRVRVRDSLGPVGEGTHERFAVSGEAFLQKLAARHKPARE